MKIDNFCIFILSHGRSNNIYTIKTLKKHGYTGKIIILIDDEDSDKENYLKKYDDVEVFSKIDIAKKFDEADNFENRKTIIYARNACFEVAQKRGIKYFMQMDDDYTKFESRLYSNVNQTPKNVTNLDYIIAVMLDFYKKTNIASISMAQGGDFIGGKHNRMAKKPTLFRKCMNSFICSTDRPFMFQGRINEDVNTYTNLGAKGVLFFTMPFVSLCQKQTQKNKGGMTDTYINQGTYVKSFYTIMFQPSSVTIKKMGNKNMRLHHSINWNCTTPKILNEKHKKVI